MRDVDPVRDVDEPVGAAEDRDEESPVPVNVLRVRRAERAVRVLDVDVGGEGRVGSDVEEEVEVAEEFGFVVAANERGVRRGSRGLRERRTAEEVQCCPAREEEGREKLSWLPGKGYGERGPAAC